MTPGPFRSPPALAPQDAHNRALLDNVHPATWKNPQPAPSYNLVVLGAGTAGLVAAAGAAGLGAKVALIERHLMGGDCLNIGCVPSKSLLRSAHAAVSLRRLPELGLASVASGPVDFAAVMSRLRKIRAGISVHDSAKRFAELGVDVFLGHGQFCGPDTIEVNGQPLRFRTAVIATGGRPRLPDVPGLAEAGPYTNETIFNLTERPASLAVLGGGPIGCELAQAFQRLGVEVTLLHNKAHLLEREDPDAAELVLQALRRDGVRVLLQARMTAVEPPAAGGSSSGQAAHGLRYEVDGKSGSLSVAAVLVATGREPNLEGLNLAAAGVEWEPGHGLRVDDYLRTTNRRVFACGDVCMNWKFTHAADFAARLVLQNALFALGPFGRRRLSSLLMPWCTYTDPEVARVGLSEAEARERGVPVDAYLQPFDKVDRALTDSETEGFVKILTRRGGGEILGATIVGAHAGDLISEVTTAMQARLSLGKLASVIHPYPTRAEAIRKCGDLFNRTRLAPGLKRWLRRWFAWRR